MSKSKVVLVSQKGKQPKKGKRGRKVGKGDRKLSRSRWGSYTALINHQQSRRLGKLARRQCKDCLIQFHSIGAKKLHDCNFSLDKLSKL